MYPQPPHYHLLWGWNNFQHALTYVIRYFYMPNTKPRKWHSLRTILQSSYSITFPPNIKNLNHIIQEFLRHRFRSAYNAQSYSVQEPAFIKNTEKKNAC